MASPLQNTVAWTTRGHRVPVRGFTLIEMFVVLSIVAVMASLLLMGFGRAMQLSKMAKSTSNLRAIATSINLYVSDSQGRYPYLCDNSASGDYTGTSYQGNYWSDLIRPYLPPNQSYVNYSGQKFNQSPTLIDPFMKNGQHHTICDYGGSTEVFRFPWLNAAMRAATVSRASQVVMVVTAGTSLRATWYLDVSSYVNSYANKTNDVNDRGTGEILCVFIDGHTEAIPTAEFVENRRTLLLMNP